MLPIRARSLVLWFSLVLSLFSSAVMAQDNGWSTFKNRFLMPDGRIIDTANHNVSHTEGQGFGMVLAVFNDDQKTFDQLWQWANTRLYRKEIGLYSWRYDPAAKDKVADANNASDGDTLIAWALLMAGEKWHQPSYTQASDKLQAALIKYTVMDFAGYKVMLPGISGFDQTSSITVNPSYFIFPAWKAFYQRSHLKVWKELDESATRMLDNMAFGPYRLPTDWVTIQTDGTMTPGSKWPTRFSFDAIRIPLYLAWAHPGSPQLSPFIQFWQKFPREQTPAWVDVMTGSKAGYNLSPGTLAIRDLTMANSGAIDSTLQAKEDYYSSSLHLLSWWAAKDQQ